MNKAWLVFSTREEDNNLYCYNVTWKRRNEMKLFSWNCNLVATPHELCFVLNSLENEPILTSIVKMQIEDAEKEAACWVSFLQLA